MIKENKLFFNSPSLALAKKKDGSLAKYKFCQTRIIKENKFL